jgi:WD40-like Beta Propeller Repeat
MVGMRAFVLGVVVAIGVCASPAWGAVPGRDGDLVVGTGGGLELVAPGTGAARPICTNAVLCGHPAQPRFSPNGRAIVFIDSVTRRPVVVAADGSCLWCLLGGPLTSVAGSEPAFTPDGQGVTVAGNGLWSIGLAGGGARRLVKGRVDGAVWSSRGRVALVRGAWIWVRRAGRGKLRRLARGRLPSFSPDGTRLAFARHGYVWVVAVGGGAERRLVRGGSPAWSPDGRQIAYIAAGGAVKIIAVRGGRSHRVSAVHGTALDWQPLPVSARRPCAPPRGSRVLASDPEAVVYSEARTGSVPPDTRFYGCLKALGQTRLLLNESAGYFESVVAVRLAGRFAALEYESGNQYGNGEDLMRYDLGSGHAARLAAAGFDGGPWTSGLDSLALDSSGFTAWRETTTVQFPEDISAVSCPSPSLCVAGDGVGDILSSTNPGGGAGAWRMTARSATLIFFPAITELSCPSTSVCFGFSSNALLSSTDPTGGASAWTQTSIDPQNILGALACPSVSLCVATDVGDILTSTDPTGGASAWAKTSIGQDDLIREVSCPSVSLCAAVDSDGNILTSTDPTGGTGAWTKTPIDHADNLLAISCPSVSLCVVAHNGGLLTSTDPTGGAGTWKNTTVGLGEVSCPSVSLCVAVGSDGSILTSTDPTGGAGAWTKTPVDQAGDVLAISCPSVSLCVAGNLQGNVLTSTDPTGGANAWTSAAVDLPPCASQSGQCVSEQLYARDDDGSRPVDSTLLAGRNSLGKVTLDADSLALSWTHDGTQRRLQLR